MDCPTCGIELNRTTYEGAPLHECPQCEGYLVSRGRLVLIRRSRDQSTDVLEAEAARTGGDVREDLRCPRCRAREMRKQRVPVDGDAFTLDVCDECDLVWFDAGELARMQLQHERSAQALEAVSFQERSDRRTPQERADLERRLESLPEPTSWLDAAAAELLLIVATIGLLVLMLGSLVFASAGWTAVLSLGFAVCLAGLIIRRLGTTRAQLATLAAVAAAELVFLLVLFDVW